MLLGNHSWGQRTGHRGLVLPPGSLGTLSRGRLPPSPWEGNPNAMQRKLPASQRGCVRAPGHRPASVCVTPCVCDILDAHSTREDI